MFFDVKKQSLVVGSIPGKTIFIYILITDIQIGFKWTTVLRCVHHSPSDRLASLCLNKTKEEL